jgi:hypothetical protein
VKSHPESFDVEVDDEPKVEVEKPQIVRLALGELEGAWIPI